MASAVNGQNMFIEYIWNNSALEITDIFKFLYQSCFGCEHLVSEGEKALAWILEEAAEAGRDDLPEVEMLDGDFCRVHLKVLQKGIGAEALCRAFVNSGEKQADGSERLKRELRDLEACAEKGLLPFSADTVSAAVKAWKEAGYPAVHHSETFRNAHHPAYRVVKKKYLKELHLNGWMTDVNAAGDAAVAAIAAKREKMPDIKEYNA